MLMCIPVLWGRLNRFMSLWILRFYTCRLTKKTVQLHPRGCEGNSGQLHQYICGGDSGQLHQRVCGENPGRPAGPRSNKHQKETPHHRSFCRSKILWRSWLSTTVATSALLTLMIPKSIQIPQFFEPLEIPPAATINQHLQGTYRCHRKLCALTPADLSPTAVFLGFPRWRFTFKWFKCSQGTDQHLSNRGTFRVAGG